MIQINYKLDGISIVELPYITTSILNFFLVSSGIVTVNSDSSIQVLAEEAASLDQLDPHAVKDGMSRAQSELSSATTELGKTEAQIAVEVFEEMSRALQEQS
uniref:ATP synthase subunit delta, mitochondrial n=1 Tax=Schistosoma haematobium TaxID=6185 RepID=A0A095A051_SCHHA